MFAFFYSFQFSLLEIKEVNQHAAYTLYFLVIDPKGINMKNSFVKHIKENGTRVHIVK